MKRLAALVLAVALLLPTPALAQGGSESTRFGEGVAARIAEAHQARIAGGAVECQPPNRLKLSYYVAVVGESSKPIDLFKDFDTIHGAVPFTAPSHQELFDQVTPREFRAPAADILGAAVWLGTKLAKKTVDNRKK